MHLVYSVGKEFTHTRLLLWTAPCRLSNTDISTCPLMHRCCQQSTANAHNQAQEPEHIYPDNISRGRERGWFSNRGGDGSACYVRVGENLVDIPKVKCG